MIKKVLNYLNAAVTHSSAPELCAIALDIAVYCICGNVQSHLYLWLIMLLCDLLIVGAHGAWIVARGHPVYGPWRASAPFLVRCLCVSVLIFLTIQGNGQNPIAIYLWYVLVISAVCHAFYCILLAMHKTNRSWLEGTKGRIGIPNWISIARMALSVIVPHLYATQPFGKGSSIVATSILALAIATDAADGYIARRFQQTTKAGKALDPLGDKVIFYPTAIAFVIATKGTAFLDAAWMHWVFYAALFVMFARDALFFAWFFLYYTKLRDGIGAGLIDKVRMGTMCVWLGLSAFALTFPSIQDRMATAGLYVIIAVAVLSIASIISDYGRMKPLLSDSNQDDS